MIAKFFSKIIETRGKANLIEERLFNQKPLLDLILRIFLILELGVQRDEFKPKHPTPGICKPMDSSLVVLDS
jgi:hypothetical protein